MLEEADASQDRALALEPRPLSAWRVAKVRALPRQRLAVTFNDGTSGEVDMARLIQAEDAGVFAVLRDPARFEEVTLDFGAVSWPSGPDLAPDAMYRAIRAEGCWRP